MAIVAIAGAAYFISHGGGPPVIEERPSSNYGAYSTHFALTEDPISENGHWLNGQAIGGDWSDVQTAQGIAFGTQSGTRKYNDSTALLEGSWGRDQMVEAQVYSRNQSEGIFEEVELRLRSSLAPHRAVGYEINFRCLKSANAYTQIVRWNGALGDFTYLRSLNGPDAGVANGDIVRATAVGNLLTAYINGVKVLEVEDASYRIGSPGIGFYVEGSTGVSRDFGFTKLWADDQFVGGSRTGTGTHWRLLGGENLGLQSPRDIRSGAPVSAQINPALDSLKTRNQLISR